eukprot:4035464-Amphidinium_carterae.1
MQCAMLSSAMPMLRHGWCGFDSNYDLLLLVFWSVCAPVGAEFMGHFVNLKSRCPIALGGSTLSGSLLKRGRLLYRTIARLCGGYSKHTIK